MNWPRGGSTASTRRAVLAENQTRPAMTSASSRISPNRKAMENSLQASSFEESALQARQGRALAVRPLGTRVLSAEDQHAIVDLAETQRHHVLGVVLIELPRTLRTLLRH